MKLRQTHKSMRGSRVKRADDYGKSVKPDVKNSDDMHIYISPVMLIMAVYFVAMGMAYEFVCSLAAVLLHECAHAKVAKKFGYALNVVKLMPYGAALCGDNDIRPKHEIVIAVAGPLFNLAVATLFAALWWLLPQSYIFTRAFCMCNLYIALFNVLPVYPLDGGRVLFAVLTLKLKRPKAYMIMRIISAVFGLIAIGLFCLSIVYVPNICLLSVGIFMLASAFIPDKRAQYTALFAMSARRQRLGAPLEIQTFAVSESAELAKLCTVLEPDKFSEFVIIDDNTLHEKGRLDETELIDGIKYNGYDAPVSELTDRKKVFSDRDFQR